MDFFKDLFQKWIRKVKINQKKGLALIVVACRQIVEQLISVSDGLKNLSIYTMSSL